MGEGGVQKKVNENSRSQVRHGIPAARQQTATFTAAFFACDKEGHFRMNTILFQATKLLNHVQRSASQER